MIVDNGTVQTVVWTAPGLLAASSSMTLALCARELYEFIGHPR